MIQFTNVSKKYDNGTHALKDINLTIDKGEFVFVVGSSGAGKSTFLKLMMREEVPSSGSIIVEDKDLTKMKKREIPKFRRKLGIVFQDFRLIPNMTVFDNVAFAMRVIGTKEKKIRRRVPYVLSLMGLNEKARNYPQELSGGEQQRVAIARALAKSPKLLLCDEPTGALDYATGKVILKLLQDTCREKGMTVIVITHNQALTPMADRVIKMKSAKVYEMTVNENPVPVEQIEW